MNRLSCSSGCGSQWAIVDRRRPQTLWKQMLLGLVALLVVGPVAHAQKPRAGARTPRIGYLYPAGGQIGTVAEVTVGGQFVSGTESVVISGEGITATVLKHKRPLTQREVNQLRQKLDEARKKFEAKQGGGRRGRFANRVAIARIAIDELGVTEEQIKAFTEYRKQRSDPKRQPNPQIAETVTLRMEVDKNAVPGKRDLRLKTPGGLSNPLGFFVGQWPEYLEREPNNTAADRTIKGALPMVLNGQILPGDVDRFRFRAEQGCRLVIVASARELMPYLADAVPGWFQATLALYDADGKEVAYADDYQFHPDPVLYFKIPKTGEYELEIKDAVYRGREDFVYRISLGEIPFVKSIFPLGGRVGQQATVHITGWNLPKSREITLDTESREPGIHLLSVRRQGSVSNQMPFVVDTLTEVFESEPNNDRATAQLLTPPLVVNGHIDKSGDRDVFSFKGRASGRIAVEVLARRLNSPIDSQLKLTDADGHEIAMNDDHEDKGAGLTTHHADSLIETTLPKDGMYFLTFRDTQQKGGPDYGYRLRISARRPDFQLRVVPSTINARAGMTVPITVFALRQDGFEGDIALALKKPPAGFRLSGNWVPAGQDQVRFTLTVPPTPKETPFRLVVEGRATIKGNEVRREAVPADDMMQAFIYHHLVPATDLLVSVTGFQQSAAARARFAGGKAARAKGRFNQIARFQRRGPGGVPLKFFTTNPVNSVNPVKIPVGGTARITLPSPGRSAVDRVQLELSDPPDGIAVDKVASDSSHVFIVVRSDAEKTKPGLKGNLIVNILLKRPTSGKNSKANRRPNVPVGTLPAIPFEIVQR